MGGDVKKRITVAVGTRPDAIKLSPLISELLRHEDIEVRVCLSGQHRELVYSVLSELGVRYDAELDIERIDGGLSELTVLLLRGFERELSENRPDMLLVHGDTTTALCAAMAGFYAGVPVGHIEAGLRTYDMLSPYPEEFNRRAIAAAATWHFAPTEAARENLISEGVAEDRIFTVGNTVTDALEMTRERDFRHPLLNATEGKRRLLLTLHRRETDRIAAEGMLRAIRETVKAHPDTALICPIHPSPRLSGLIGEVLDGSERIYLTGPLGVRDFHNIMSRCELVLTDSGGLQEEAAYLKRPLLLLRETTERPEASESGGMKVIGCRGEDVARELGRLLDERDEYEKMSGAVCPYTKGATVRIADILEKII